MAAGMWLVYQLIELQVTFIELDLWTYSSLVELNPNPQPHKSVLVFCTINVYRWLEGGDLCHCGAIIYCQDD